MSDQRFSQKFDGGDASENCDFQRGKQRLQGTKFSNITKWHYFLDELNLKLKTNFEDHKMALCLR